jgi:hypothetical protein
MISIINRIKIPLFVLIGLVGLTIFIQLFSVPKASAAPLCYTETAPFKVQATTFSCPQPSSSVQYNTTYNANNSNCYVKKLPLRASTIVVYEEQNCSDLEILRTNARQEACESSDGEWVLPTPGDTSPTATARCVCPAGKKISTISLGCITNQQAQQEAALQDPKFVSNDCNDVTIDESNCGILRYVVIITNFLSAMVGIVVVGSLILGGIQYSMSGSDPQKVSAAKTRIRNSIIALIVFIFTYSFLNYLIPGGVL